MTRVLRSGRLVQGQEVAAFEEEFAAVVGGRTCVAVNSGHQRPAPRPAGRGHRPGRRGRRPLLHLRRDRQRGRDDRRDTRCSPTSSRTPSASTPTRWPPLSRLVRRRSSPCTSTVTRPPGRARRRGRAARPAPARGRRPGARARRTTGRRSGALGDVAAFSFYATKNMTTGEGGMVVCRDEADRPTRPAAAQPGHGAALPQRDRRAEQPDDRRRRGHGPGPAASAAPAGTSDDGRSPRRTTSSSAGVVSTPPVAPKAEPSSTSTPCASHGPRRAARLVSTRSGIDSAVFYPVPTHRLPAYDLDAGPARDRAAAREVLSLPIRPGLTDDEVARVVAAVNEEATDELTCEPGWSVSARWGGTTPACWTRSPVSSWSASPTPSRAPTAPAST